MVALNTHFLLASIPILSNMSTKEKPSTTVTTAAVTPTSPIEAITLDNGWKITIKNPDGTSNELLLEPQRAPTSATLDDSDMEKASPSSSETAKMPAGPKLRWYLVVQYILNTLLAISIIAIMALTLVKYNSTKHITGAWPTNAVLSPTLLMLAVSVLNVLVDAANLLVQCCGSRAISAMTRIVIAVRKYTGVVTTFLPAFAAGLAAFGKNNTGGKDLWGYSCSSAADAMAAVNGSDMVCMTNVCPVLFHFHSPFARPFPISLPPHSAHTNTFPSHNSPSPGTSKSCRSSSSFSR
jgi:hypothetical protein